MALPLLSMIAVFDFIKNEEHCSAYTYIFKNISHMRYFSKDNEQYSWINNVFGIIIYFSDRHTTKLFVHDIFK